ncbi:MAG: hypothetical protein WAV50_02740 [Minisyncoccia bacterium]
MQRNLIIAAIALVVILGLGTGAYFLFFEGKPSVSVAPTGSSLPSAGQVTQSTGTGNGSSEPGGSGTGITNAPVAVSGRLVQISAGPVVPGMVVTDKKPRNASSTPEVMVSYIERGSGNVFSYTVGSKTITRINNKTIPGIQSASWLPDASAAFVRYLSGEDLSTINTYSLSATSTSGFFLPQNLLDISVSSTSVLSLASGVNGSAISAARTDGTRSTTIFTTPLTSLRASFAGKGQYLVYTKPSATLTGDAFLVDSNGFFSHVAGPLSGLSALASPSGKWLLVSYIQGATMQMQLVDTVTNTTLPLPVSSLTDKCVWTSDNSSIYCGVPVSPNTSATYPDDWYQGAAHFSDRIWKIDVAGRYAQLVLDFSQAGKGALDATAFAINPSRTMLVFINKNDGSLWGYSL